MSVSTYRPQHVYDALPSRPDRRDRIAAPVDVSAIPDVIDLPPVPILDQAQEGSCVGHGCAGARETLELIVNGSLPMTPLSRAFIYYMARKLEGTTGEDSGAEVRDGCKVMKQTGVCTEDEFPYKVGDFAKTPPKIDVTAAAKYKIGGYTNLGTFDQLRAALAANQPVVIGISVYQSFEQQVGTDGYVPLPDPTTEQLLGGHCLYVRGAFPDPHRPGKFRAKVPNSWGVGWADNGVCYIPDDYLNDANLCSDMWAITP